MAFGTTPGRDDVVVDVGKVTTWTFGSAMNGVTYYFRVHAYDTMGRRSGPSSEISTTVLGSSPAVAGFSVERGQLDFGAVRAGSVVTSLTPAQNVIVANNPGATWTASSTHPWIRVSPAGGTGSGLLAVSLAAGSIPGPGTYDGAVYVTSSGVPMPILVRLRVHAAGGTSRPVGSFDTPVDGAVNVIGAIPVTGWALDDVETTKVEIYRDAVGGEPAGSLIYVGQATFLDNARPDVESAYTNMPMRYRAGWGLMVLTNMLPDVAAGTQTGGNGTYRLHAYASDAEGNVSHLGVRWFTAANRHATTPFGTIDTPAPGGIVSGSSYVNFGWALSPVGTIPPDGSTITVYIDGVAVGHPTYNTFRQDVAGTFPGYANSAGANGYFVIDTTRLTNGVHTISWGVTDNLGNTAGLGSRFFTVLNGGSASPTAAAQIAAVVPESSGALVGQNVAEVSTVQTEPSVVEVTRPAETSAAPEVLSPTTAGQIEVRAAETELIEVRLGRGQRGRGGSYEGYLVVEGQMRPLPAGSTLDAEGGLFSWQPGAGFIGVYDFVFLRTSQSGLRTKVPVQIRIEPKFDRHQRQISRVPRER